jgi:hypothetical protein
MVGIKAEENVKIPPNVSPSLGHFHRGKMIIGVIMNICMSLAKYHE